MAIETTRMTLTIDNEALDMIAEIQASVKGALDTKLTRSRIVSAAVRQYHRRLMKALADD